MEALEEPNEWIDEQNPEEELDPFVRQGAGKAVGGSDVDLGSGYVERNFQYSGIVRRPYQCLDGLSEVSDVPAIYHLWNRVLVCT